MEEVDGIADGGGVSDGSSRLEDVSERWGFEETSEKEVPL